MKLRLRFRNWITIRDSRAYEIYPYSFSYDISRIVIAPKFPMLVCRALERLFMERLRCFRLDNPQMLELSCVIELSSRSRNSIIVNIPNEFYRIGLVSLVLIIVNSIYEPIDWHKALWIKILVNDWHNNYCTKVSNDVLFERLFMERLRCFRLDNPQMFEVSYVIELSSRSRNSRIVNIPNKFYRIGLVNLVPIIVKFNIWTYWLA